MDPEEALKNARAALKAYREACDRGNEWNAEGYATDLADAFEALDGWMSKGGFPPRAWAQRAL